MDKCMSETSNRGTETYLRTRELIRAYSIEHSSVRMLNYIPRKMSPFKDFHGRSFIGLADFQVKHDSIICSSARNCYSTGDRI